MLCQLIAAADGLPTGVRRIRLVIGLAGVSAVAACLAAIAFGVGVVTGLALSGLGLNIGW